ncbi:MAG: PKD domain-containing protein [Vicingaceae bacterium]
MNKPTNLLLNTLAFLFFFNSYAGTFYGTEADKKVKNASFVYTNTTNGSIKFVKFKKPLNTPAFIGSEWLRQLHNSSKNDQFAQYEAISDKLGYVHYRYYQTYKGIRVESAVFYIHTLRGQVISANGDYTPNIKLPSTNPSITKEQAITAAKRRVDNNGTWYDQITSSPKLVVVKVDEEFKLAYKVDIYAANPLSRYYIFIDAQTSDELYRLDRIHHADSRGTAVTRYNGTKTITTDSTAVNSFRLRESGRGNGIETFDLNQSTSYFSAVDFTDANNYWDVVTNDDDAAYDAHYGSEMTYDYFFNKFGRDSYDDSGAVIKSYVHYSSNYSNAFWDGFRMTYGDGDGVNYSPLTSIDVVGHEIAHAVTENTADLIYSYQSGALNESFSDIFGIAIDYYANPTTANYTMGEQFALSGNPFRSMESPNRYGDPDTYLGTNWYSGSLDNGGVHTNSGVQNFWFYLLVEGGRGINDNTDYYDVTGIGMDKAAEVSYRNLSVYLTPSSQYSDARQYAIQSAIDLYDTCSQEVISVTNAWNAVGVGLSYSNAVIASFYSTETYNCSNPHTINFTNNSTNGTTYKWYFGDGDSSTLAAPSHQYDSAGQYNVTLIVNGTSNCNLSDTVVLTNYITIDNNMSPKGASCTPGTSNASTFQIGIYRVKVGSIDHSTSAGGTDGYQDYTCSVNLAELIEGNSIPVEIQTGPSYDEDVRIWIDLNNDSSFNAVSELVYSSNDDRYHTGSFIIAQGAVKDTTLRMRVASDYAPLTITNCSTITYGQVEDYSVIIRANTNPPIADFSVTPNQINAGGTANFNDLSQNIPTSWSWSFPGGSPSTSSVQNPSIIYPSNGAYDVTLIATNSYGTDTITKTSFLNVVNNYVMCTDDSSSQTNGKLFDSGGEFGNYSNRESCTFLINPSCATSITLSFNSFSLEGCCDYFRVYDGNSTAGTLLLSANGTSLPNSVTANSGEMFIRFTSDGSVVRSGWDVDWSSTVVSTSVVADFTSSSTNPILNSPVQFSDLTSNSPDAWSWDFGDGNTSFIQNPEHTYTSSGNYNVRLISRSCVTNDTVTKTINVQPSGIAAVTPASIIDTVDCGDSVDVIVQIKNTGLGDMVYTIGQVSNSDTLEVLALQYGTDLFREYPNTLTAINSSFNSYRLTELNTTDSSTLKTNIQGKDVILIPELESSNSNVFTDLSNVLQNFVNGGGTVIFCGTGSANVDGIFNTGLFSGNYVNFINNSSLTSTNPTSPIHDSVTYPFSAPSATFTYNFTDPNIEDYISYLGNSVVASRKYGLGEVYMVGFDYFNFTSQTQRILGNVFRVIQSQVDYSNWISTSANIDTVAAGDSANFTVKLSAKDLFAGTYYDTLLILTTDSSQLEIELPIQYTVIGTAVLGVDKDTVEFPLTQVGAVKTSPLVVYNYGCDTLIIDSISLSHADFTVDSVFSILPPFESDTLEVAFSPSTIRSYDDSMLIYTIDSVLRVSLVGQSEGAPSLSYNPQSIVDTIANCGDSIIIPVSFYNSGQGALSLKLNASDNIGISFNTENKVLLVRNGNAWGNNENFKVLDSMGVDVTTIGSALFGTTVLDSFNLIVFESNQSSTFYNTLQTYSTKLDTYLSNGGSVHMSITNQSNYNFPGGVLKTTSSPQYYDTNFVVNQSHPFHKGCTGPYLGNSASHYGLTSLPSGSTILAENSLNVPTAVEVKIGNGTMLAFGMTLEFMIYNNYNCTSLLRNSFEYLLSKSRIGSDWISLSPDSLYIPINDSGIVNVTLRSNDYSSGVYQSNILIASNDPLKLFDTIPVTMVLEGSPLAVLSDTVVAFPSITQYTSARDSVLFTNEGCDTLRITNVLNTSSEFSTDTTEYFILPSDSSLIYFNFNPTTTGLVEDTFRFVNNGPEIKVYVSGTSVSAPDIRISEQVLNDTIRSCNDSIIRSIKIYNDGGNNLDWEFNVDVSTFEDFENGLDVTKWSVSGGLISQSCNTYSGTGAMYFNGGGQRSIATTALDLSRSNEVEFYLKYGNSSGSCETLDPGEEVLLEYSTNNGFTWNFVRTYSIFNHAGNFTFVSESLPAGAKTAQTLLRWRQRRSSGSCCDHWAIDDISLEVSGSFENFVTNISPDSATTSSSDSASVDITLNSTGLSSGTYTTKLFINSNDPVNPYDSITINLVVDGTPEYVLSDSCIDFGLVLNNDTKLDSIQIINTGCEDLLITGTILGNASYTLLGYPDTLEALDTTVILLEFNPTSIGNFNSYLRLFNNYIDTNICLKGESVPAPIIDLNPDSIYITVNSCEDSVVVPFTIKNAGGSILNYEIQSNKDSINILALTYGVDYFGEFANTKTALSNNLSNYTLTELNSTDSTVIKSALNGIDVVLIPEIESGFSNNFSNYSPPLNEFVNDGGSVIFCGTSRSSSLINIGLFSGSYSTNASGRQASFTASHPILDSVNSPFNMAGGSYGYLFTNSDAVTIVEYLGSDIVTYRDLGAGKGKVVYMAFDFFSYNADMAKILGNSFKWVSRGNLPSWIGIQNLQDSLSGSDSNIVNVSIYPKGLSTGLYKARLKILNNDPVNGDIELPITLDIVPDPCSEFSFIVNDVCNGIVQFSDSSSNSPTSWSWDFGDSTNSSLQNPSHTYSEAGIYEVELIVSNSFGSDTSSQMITINKMIADFSVDSPLVLNRFINFTSNAPGAISWNWDFGNGVKGTGSSLSYSYSTPGLYDVTLIASNGFNCKDTIIKTINIIAVGLEDFGTGEFGLFPNPSDGKFNIQLPKNKFLSKVEIYSYNGQLVFEKDFADVDQKTEVELLNPVVGVYLVKVWTTTDDFIERKLFIKR